MKKNITELTLEGDKILDKDVLDDKIGILDIRAKIEKNTNVDIEMQVVDHKNIEKRILFYASRMMNKSITPGKDYSSIEKSVAILITDYELDSLKNIKKYTTKWNLREEDYGNVILTDAIEIYIIEIPKLEKYSTNTILDKWVKFIKNPKVIDMSEKEINIMDQKATEDAGFDKGLKQGEKNKSIEIAKKLKSKGFKLDEIYELTNLPIEEIETL